jgi:hypothetical protein
MAHTTVLTLKMLELTVVELAQLGVSDCKEALLLKAVWRSATTMSGAQCAMISGTMWMLVWPADSWDLVLLVLWL